jgi:hypothetical protein
MYGFNPSPSPLRVSEDTRWTHRGGTGHNSRWPPHACESSPCQVTGLLLDLRTPRLAHGAAVRDSYVGVSCSNVSRGRGAYGTSISAISGKTAIPWRQPLASLALEIRQAVPSPCFVRFRTFPNADAQSRLFAFRRGSSLGRFMQARRFAPSRRQPKGASSM